MKALLKILSKFFSGQDNQIITSEELLKEYKWKVEIDKFVEIGSNRVNYSKDYSFQTPDEILKLLNNNTLLWVDERNNLLGFSNNEKSLIIPLRDVKGFEIQNILPGRGPGESYFSVCLPNSKYLILSIASNTCNFDTYAAKISGTLGVKVAFAPEFYNC
ncbi:hypothetical protein MP478_16985 [Chryseobacterium sp. WG14]|uniref:hypothetical protein n=1 Tax=Chryseobacterium sp. WG14 TaxID=2926909 RepID=UPI00211DB6D6|nr:hypothetical protein [Chryseobacterium sp. WG14]MCQ9641081.1 hypothetical protein [Chryseobacterium sp. WG14]